MRDRRADLDRLYSLLGELETRCGGRRRLASCNGRMGWPRRGVYFFFEPGELREDGRTSRVVRVGTHGLRPSKSTLWGRLSQHRGRTAGRYAGGGNHRGSIFRLHVGTALLANGEWPDEVRSTWPEKLGDPLVRLIELELERAVSRCIGQMPFLWINVDDEPSAASHRGVIESNAIALLSNTGKATIDAPSQSWLGRRSDRDAVQTSGLWNVNHVRAPYSADFLDVFDAYLRGM